MVREGFSLAAPVEGPEYENSGGRHLNQGPCLANFSQPEKLITSPPLEEEMVSESKASTGQPLRSHGALFA